MKKDHQLVHSKFWSYLDRFIHRLVSNFFQCFIAKHNLEIIYSETIVYAAWKKLISRVAQKRRVITIWDMQAKITKQAQNKLEKVKKVSNWAKAAEFKKKNAKNTMQKKLQKQLHKKLKVYLKAWLALTNLLKWFDWVICRYSWKIRFYKFWAIINFKLLGIYFRWVMRYGYIISFSIICTLGFGIN